MRERMSSTIATEGRPADRHDECRIRIAAAGDIHYGERADDRERARGRVRGPRRPRRRRAAGRRPDHPRRARAGADRRRRRCATSTIPVHHRARQPRLARQPRRRVRRGAARGRRDRDGQGPQPRRPRSLRDRRSGSSAPRASWAASRARTCRTSASRRCAASTPSRWRRPRRWTRACARSRCARSGSCSCTTRPTTADARGRAPRDLDVPRHRPARAADPRAQPRTWSCTATPTRARSRAGSARCRSTTSPCPCMGEDWWVFELAGDRRAALRSALARFARCRTSLRSGSSPSGGFGPPSVVASASSPAARSMPVAGGGGVVAGGLARHSAAQLRLFVIETVLAERVGHHALLRGLGPLALVLVVGHEIGLPIQRQSNSRSASRGRLRGT